MRKRLQFIHKHVKKYLLTVGVSVLATSAFAQFPAPYCDFTTTNNVEPITLVNFAGINQASGNTVVGGPIALNAGLVDYTAVSGTVTQGGTYPTIMKGNTDGGSFTTYFTIFIDWNQNNSFAEADEIYQVGSVTGSTGLDAIQATGSVLVPMTALAGTTRMRVVKRYNAVSTGACTTNWGQGQDYTINVLAAGACTGTPAPVVISGPASVCASAAFTLTATGATVASGISYDWQKFDGTNWVSTGGTGSTYSVTAGITAAAQYRFVTNCSNGGGQDISNVLSVGLSPFYACYCASSALYTGDGEVSNVTVGPLNNSSTCAQTGGTGSVLNRYSDYTALPATSLMQGATYPVSVTAGSCGGSYAAYVKIFVDYDHDGAFTGVDELAYSGMPPGGMYTAAGVAAIGTLAIPSTALTGITRMRVIMSQTTAAIDVVPCGSYNYGETEDYLVDITTAVSCTGNPASPVATAPASVCANVAFTLSASGFTSAPGITYEWQSSPTGAGTWTAITGATLPVYTVTAGQSVGTDYQLVTTCTSGGGQGISNTVSVGMNAFYRCYCSPLTGVTLHSSTGNYISGVSITGTTLNNPTTTNGAGGYTQFFPTTATTTTDLNQGILYTINFACPYTGYGVDLWIDYDQNGTYDAGEYIAVSGTGTSLSTTFTIPYTATAGLTGMRVRSWYTSYAAGGACTNAGGYETEDYVINIIQAVGCVGTPNPGVITAPASACPAVNFNLTANSYTSGIGITYQWQASPAGSGTWTDISGATNTTATTSQTAGTDYRMVTNCSNGGGVNYSNTLSIPMGGFMDCYCKPYYLYGGANDIVVNVTLGTLSNNTASAGNPPGFFTDFSSLQPGTLAIPDLIQTIPSNLVLTFGSDGTQYHKVWIDMDHSGTYDATEVFTGTPNPAPGSGTATVAINVPVTATLGLTKMRIRGGEDSQPTDAQACGPTGSNYGEGEDYLVNILAAPSCIPPSGLTASNVTYSTADVSWTAVTGASGYDYVVDQTSAAIPTGTSASTTAIAPPSVTGLTPGTRYYLHVRTFCGGSDYSYWSVYAFNTIPPNDLCADAIDISNGQTYNGTTAAATQSQAACDATTTANDVWYKFTTGSTAGNVTVSVNTNVTLTDVVLSVLSGTCGNFTPIVATTSSGSGSCIDGPAAGNEYGTYALLANTTYYVRVYGYNSAQGAFPIVATGTPLAVKLSEITATNVGTRNRVDWKTVTENAGDYFTVERSADGRDFTALGTVAAKGQPSAYSFWDQSPVNGVNYYRIKMIDVSGANQYSKVVTATSKGNTVFTVEAYPNPVTDVLTVKTYGAQGNNALVSISDVTGKVIRIQTVTANEVKVNMTGMAQGVYLIKYSDNKHAQTVKVTKQ